MDFVFFFVVLKRSATEQCSFFLNALALLWTQNTSHTREWVKPTTPTLVSTSIRNSDIFQSNMWFIGSAPRIPYIHYSLRPQWMNWWATMRESGQRKNWLTSWNIFWYLMEYVCAHILLVYNAKVWQSWKRLASSKINVIFIILLNEIKQMSNEMY